MTTELYKIKKGYRDLVSEDLHELNIKKDDWLTKYNIKEAMLEKSDVETSNLAFGGHPVHLQFPMENNTCSNWNDNHCIYDYIGVECGGIKGSLRYVKDIVDMYNARFDKRPFSFNEEPKEGTVFLRRHPIQVGCITGNLYELENILAEAQPVIDKIKHKSKFREFFLRIESTRVIDEKSATQTHNNRHQDQMIRLALEEIGEKINYNKEKLVEEGEVIFRKYL